MAIGKINGVALDTGGGGTPTMVHWNGGRIQQTTSNDSQMVGMGGSIGATYYNWSVALSTTNLESLGTPGTTTKLINSAYYIDVSGFFIPPNGGGTIGISGTLRDDSASSVAESENFIHVWKASSTYVTAMANGSPGLTDTATLVASTSVETPETSANIKPCSFISNNGVTVSAGDYCFVAWSTTATVTSTEYRVVNYKVFTGV